MDFYRVLQEIMLEREMSIPDIARASGLSDSTVRSIIKRESKTVALDVAAKFSHGLGVSLESLHDGFSTQDDAVQDVPSDNEVTVSKEMGGMATDKPRFSVTFTNESYEKIHEYRKANKISTQSKAVARLVEIALNDLESGDTVKSSENLSNSGASIDDLKKVLIDNFNQLNQEGQERLVETSDDMVSSGKYIKSNQDELGKKNYA